MRVQPASRAFSSNSFTTDAGRSTTSPAAILLATASDRTWIRPIDSVSSFRFQVASGMCGMGRRAIRLAVPVNRSKYKLFEALLHLDSQVFQLCLADRCGRVHHQIHGPRCLGERNHFPQTVGSRQDYHNAIKSQGNAAEGRRAVLQGFKEETEAAPGFL